MCIKVSSSIIILIVVFNKISSISNEKLINEFVVQIPGGYSEATSVAKQMGFILDHKMIGFDDLFIFKNKKKGDEVHYFFQHRIKRSNKVNFIEQQVARKRVKREPVAQSTPIIFLDPLYKFQWYLIRSHDLPDKVDMNVIEAWKLGYTGKGIVVSILDDGIDYRHPDLRDNYDPYASYDINGGDSDPLPNVFVMENRHGTRCAGEVSASANNSLCGVGIAYNSRIGAVRMLDGEVTDRVEAEALGLRQEYIDIYSGSWGPDDNGQKVEGPARLAKEAFERGIKFGRKKLGNIYVWASGNGGNHHDSCACDGYASSIYTLSVSSVSEANRKPWYLESCASTLISTYSSGGIHDKKIISTDLNGKCAYDHTGTSASAPLAAGIIALLLEANGNLTWRDVQYISVVTANPRPFLDGNFITNGANRKVSNLYGFGLMDAGKMIRLGLLWQTLPPQHICKSKIKVIDRILSGVFVEKVTLNIDGCRGQATVNFVEHVILYLTVEYKKRGDLQVFLTSPMGTRSEILPYRKLDYHSGSATFDKWPLMSVQFWGELSSGIWTLELRNLKNDARVMKGLLKSFSLEIFGTEKFPIRLKRPASTETDGWFEQFERFVVSESDMVDDIAKNTYPRDYFQSYRYNTSEIPLFKCHNQCFNNTCNGWGPQNCLFCKKYKTFNGDCVEQCLPGTYLDVLSLKCERCHYSCAECTGSGKYKCSRCNVGDSFKGTMNQCHGYVMSCSAEFTKHNSKCNKCPNNCTVCHSKTLQCSQCQAGFVLTLYNHCKPSCDLGSYADSSGKCRACHINCLTCLNGNQYECTSCDQASILVPQFDNYQQGICLKECPSSHFTNHTTRQCFRCHQNCKTCTGPLSHMCKDCIPPLLMSSVNRTCVDPVVYNCRPDEYKSTNGTCEKCPAKCQTCSNGQCTSCSHVNRFLFNSSCIDQCPTDHFAISNDNICLPCKTYCDPCNKTGSLSECGHCYQNNSRCDNQCSKIEYWDGESHSCKPCHSSCSSCTGGAPVNCINCLKKDNIITNQMCANKCSSTERIMQIDSHKLCVPCHPSCKGQLCYQDTGKCIQCHYGHRMSDDSRCKRIITCAMSSYYSHIESECKPCNKSCLSCTNEFLCNSCNKDHCLNPIDGTCRWCCSPFSSNKDCFRCISGQEFCDIQSLRPQSSPIVIHFFYAIVGLSISIFIILFFILVLLNLFKRNLIDVIKKRFRFPYSLVNDNNEEFFLRENDSVDDHSEDDQETLFRDDNAYISLSAIAHNHKVPIVTRDTHSMGTPLISNVHSNSAKQTQNTVGF